MKVKNLNCFKTCREAMNTLCLFLFKRKMGKQKSAFTIMMYSISSYTQNSTTLFEGFGAK